MSEGALLGGEVQVASPPRPGQTPQEWVGSRAPDPPDPVAVAGPGGVNVGGVGILLEEALQMAGLQVGS